MSIGIIRAKHTLSLNSSQVQQGAMPILMTLQTQENEKIFNESKGFDSGFVPFINERDRMNRLMIGDKYSTPKKQHNQHDYQGANEKWIQHDPMKLKIPPKRLSMDDRHNSNCCYQIDKQRSKSNADFRLKLLQANTERQSFLQSQDQSMHPQLEVYQKIALENVMNKNKQTTSPQARIVKNSSCENLQSQPGSMQVQQKLQKSPINQMVRIKLSSSSQKQKHFLDFKLPILIQKEYIKQFLESNKKIKDMISEQNEAKFKFPQDFEPKIVEMKLQLKRMKSKLKNWDTDREATNNKGFLKEIATGLLNR